MNFKVTLITTILATGLLAGATAQQQKRGGGKGGGGGGPKIMKPRIEDTVRANVYADNWFVMYINGKLATADSIPFIPHNVVSVDLLPEYPMTIAVMARDNADPDTGMEYDSTNIGDGGFILKFGDGTVTSVDWKAKNFFHGPVDGDAASPTVRSEAIPRDWYAIDFDDSAWANAVEYTEEAVGPKQPYYDNDFAGAKFIWSDDLALDNTVIFRYRVEAPPNGSALPPDWPRGHIVPSATVAPSVKDASLQGATKTSGVETGLRPEASARHAAAPLLASSRVSGEGSKWEEAPAAARVFKRFEDELKINWDEDYVYVEGNSLPDHEMMVGITAWNQQVPLPQDFTGENAWRITLHPEPAEEPVYGTESLFKGAIAVAANGVPIFNPIKQDGRTDTNLAGELDEFGGHAGRGDDYHYHLPPTFLNEEFGDELPIGYGMDGYALYGFKEPDGTPAKGLDDLNGHDHGELGYHYHSSTEYPYLNGGLRGVAALRDGQVANQPRTRGVRPYTQPLRGAEITGYEKVAENEYRMEYEVQGGTRVIQYTVREDGSVAFEFVDEKGEVVAETYAPREPGGGGGQRDAAPRKGMEPRGGKGGPGQRDAAPRGGMRPPGGGERPSRGPEQAGGGEGGKPRTPWILVHAPELDTDGDGTVTMKEMMDEARMVFEGYDADGDGRMTEAEMTEGKSGVRSALNGFVKEHNLQMDRDGDGVVMGKEMADQFRKFIERQDQDGDGNLSPEEYKVEGEMVPRFPERGLPGKRDEVSGAGAGLRGRRDDGLAIRPTAERRGEPLPGGASRSPNFVVFLIDDMGWRDMGFAGNTFIETPHTDALAGEGVIFSNAYSSAPNCAPTRACLMSGQYTPRHGVYTVVDDRHRPGSLHHRVLAAESKADMAGEVVTIAEQLKAGGYATAMFGMWNLGRGRDGPTTPRGQGFEIFKRPQDLGVEKDRYFDAEGNYLTDLFTDEGIRFMEGSRDKPFFLYLAYHAVHSPFEPKPELLAKYEKKAAGSREDDPVYAAMVEAVDENVGRVMESLRALGIDENTVVIFTSDNGGTRQYTAPLRSGKGSLHEGGVRVPAAVWGPGVGIASGLESDEPILSMDFYPTMLELAKVAPNPVHRLDGASLVPLLASANGTLEREAVFWHFPSYIGGGGPSSSIRKGDWKLIEFFEDERIELYDLAKDPGESTDLSEREPEKFKELYADLRGWQEETGAPRVTEANEAFDPNAAPKRGRDERGKGGGGGGQKGKKK